MQVVRYAFFAGHSAFVGRICQVFCYSFPDRRSYKYDQIRVSCDYCVYYVYCSCLGLLSGYFLCHLVLFVSTLAK